MVLVRSVSKIFVNGHV